VVVPAIKHLHILHDIFYKVPLLSHTHARMSSCADVLLRLLFVPVLRGSRCVQPTDSGLTTLVSPAWHCVVMFILG
jgi:hypothetical protein